MEHKSPHVIILYVLLLVVAGWLVISSVTFTNFKKDQGTWVCSNVVCTKFIDGQAWAQQNCFQSPAANGSQETICKVPTDNGQFQLVPLANLTASLAQYQQCTEYACNEESNTRSVNYTVNNSTKLLFSNTVLLGASQSAPQ